jgi:ligand-binding sensor domain-containing protein
MPGCTFPSFSRLNSAASGIFAFLLVWMAGPAAFCQKLSYRNYTVNDGLPSSDVYEVLQDSKGYIWFATENGVSRFNGTTFTNFGMKDGLSDNVVVDMDESNGRVWFATLNGLPVYFSKGALHRPLVQKSYSRYTSLSVSAHKGMAYFSAPSGFFIQKGDSLIYKKMWPYKLQNLLAGFDKEGNGYMIGVYGVRVFDKKFSSSGRGLYFNAANPLFEASFVSPGNFPLFVEAYDFNGSQIRVKNPYWDGLFRKIFDHTGQVRIRSLRITGGKIWVGTAANGLYVFPENWDGKAPVKQLLPGKAITSIISDRENNVWVSTLGSGVFLFPLSFFLNYTNEDGLVENKVNCVSRDFSGNLWIGYDNGMLQKNIQGPGILLKSRGYKQPRVVDMVFDAETGGLIGSDECVSRMENGKITPLYYPFRFDNRSMITYSVKSIAVSPSNDILVATSGFFFGMDRTGALTHPIDSEYYGVRVYRGVSAGDNTFWIATAEGLLHLVGSRLIKYNTSVLSGLTITDLLVQNDSLLLLCTRQKGLIVYNRKQNRLVYEASRKEALYDKVIKRCYRGKENNTFWVVTENSFCKLSFATDFRNIDRISEFDHASGLISGEINSLCLDKDTVWIATNEGLAKWVDRKVPRSPVSLYLTRITVNKEDTTPLTELRLPYFRNSLSFSLDALSFRSLGQLSYHYILKGLDDTWSISSSSEITYNSIPPGSYTFLVNAINSEGVKSNTLRLTLEISPPFWKEKAFIFFAVLLVFSLIVLLFQISINRVRKREIQERVKSIRMTEAELKALRAQMNPHFVFNSLNAVQRFIVENNPEASYRFLSKFARLMRYVIDNSKLTLIPLEEEIKAFTLYLDLEKSRLENRFSYTIDVDESVDLSYQKIPSMIIQPYLENSIWHGFQNQGSSWRITLRFSIERKHLKCVVEDNGIGRKRSAELKSAQQTAHKSVGTRVTQERLELLNLLKQEKMSVTIIDLYDGNREPAGTRVEIFIPLEN